MVDGSCEAVSGVREQDRGQRQDCAEVRVPSHSAKLMRRFIEAGSCLDGLKTLNNQICGWIGRKQNEKFYLRLGKSI